jgi:hypothetical protein
MGRPPASADVNIEYLGQRPGPNRNRAALTWLVAAGLGAALLLALLVLLVAAYSKQSDRVDALRAQNESILADHHAIGKQFAKQSKQFTEESRKLEKALQSAYGRGFRAGRETANLPPTLRSLGALGAAGFFVPRSVPSNGEEPRVHRNLEGYTVRWPHLALFASRLEPLSNWTRQALGDRRRLVLGGHRVERLLGPSGVIYSWREAGVTYAVISTAAQDTEARMLIASMR